jgi:hypothetical protein
LFLFLSLILFTGAQKKFQFFISAFVLNLQFFFFFLRGRCIGEPIYVRESRASGFSSYLIVFMFGVVIWMNWIFVFTFGCVSDD